MADIRTVSPIIHRNSAVKHPRIASFGTSLKVITAMGRPQTTDDVGSESIYTISSFYYPKSTIQDPSEVPDLSMCAHNRAHTDDHHDFETSQEHSKVKRRYSDTPQGNSLPILRPLSPLRNPFSRTPSLVNRSAHSVVDRLQTPPTPMECNSTEPAVMESPQDLGWGDFRSSRASFDGADPETPYTSWPKSDKQMPSLLPLVGARPDYEKENKNKKVPIASVEKAFKSRKHSDMESLMKVQKFGNELRMVYHEGCKGEGQEMWNAIRRLKKEKRELKPTKASLKAPWAARSPRTRAAQKEQLDAIHVAAMEMPPHKELAVSPPISKQPQPLGVVRSPIIPEPSPGFFFSEARGREGSQVRTTSMYTYHSRDVPITAARSVLYDSKENIIDHPQNVKAFAPKLAPAPKSRAFQEKGLPPPPIRCPGEPEPPELARQREAYRRRVGTSPPRHGEVKPPPASQHPVGPKFTNTAAKPQNKHPAERFLAVSQDFPYAASNPPSHSTSLDDRQTERPRHQKEPKKAKPYKAPKKPLADAFSTFFDPPSHHKDIRPKYPFTDLPTLTKDKARAKHQQKLKEAISGPRPVMAPVGGGVNFATEAGGVGGKGAAVAVAPPVSNPEWAALEEKRKAKKDAGKLGLSTKPNFGFLHTAFVKEIGVREIGEEMNGTGKKDRKAKRAKGSRRDSDASMVCAGAALVSQIVKGKQKADDGPGPKMDMMVFKGPVEQFSDQQVREVKDSGPSRQMVEWPPVEDERLVPKPLGVRKVSETGETYSKYENVLREYREDGSVWI
ncbi:uncharacterized protein CC84DRAFT_302447 [Paraphaeosphaeria sporulosa]|uniref:Uncharacterized protein n=1 Tax=Paraphaeosphaeria sporulosa TaxID=1460663 RepID=A0A177BY63_9PLEO|nr:uncharacterized protein CC84DRAFT_302447 [Paraphaeosphaeria sporulosa]OAG00454.1 hypothetical protein CC84DRAFT_302447 [Paraphaeosphaeria sporulosa]